MLFFSYAFFMTNTFVHELIQNENGEAHAGILGLIPNFNPTDYQITKKDRVIYERLEVAMCKDMCPCNGSYEKLF